MVVSGGLLVEATSTSSKPSTETSRGTRSPASRRARIAPIAVTSLKAKIAVKGCLVSSNFRVTSRPGPAPGSGLCNCTTSRGSTSMPRLRATSTIACHRGLVSELKDCPLMKAIRLCPSD